MKKILAILLTVCMVVCMIPGAAFADTAPTDLSNATISISNTGGYYSKADTEVANFTTTYTEITVKVNNTVIPAGQYQISKTVIESDSKVRVLINGNGTNTTGTKAEDFDIVSNDFNDGTYFISSESNVNNSDIKPIITDQSFTGTEIKPTVYLYKKTTNEGTVTINKVDNSLYDLSYSNNRNVGEATAVVTATGKGTARGSVGGVFSIKPVDFPAVNSDSAKNTNNAIVSDYDIDAKLNNTKLIKGTDYTLTFKYKDNNTFKDFSGYNFTEGTYKAVVTPKTNFTTTAAVETNDFQVTSNFTGATVKVENTDFTYNGKPQTPTITVTKDNKPADSKSYSVTYSDAAGKAVTNPTNAGKYTAVIKAVEGNSENLSGEKTVAFTIKPIKVQKIKGLGNYVYMDKVADQKYTGKALTPIFNVYYQETKSSSAKVLAKNTDYTVTYSNNISVGIGRVTVTFTGNYEGPTLTDTFTITNGTLLTAANTTISGVNDTYDYTGYAIKPTVYVTYRSGYTTKVLTQSTATRTYDYKVDYSSNISAGTATITITGQGEYAGTVTKTFAIKYNLSNATVTATPSTYLYDGKEKKPLVSVKVGYMVVPASNYNVVYSNNTNTGTAAVTVTAKKYGNAIGSNMAYFTITGKDGAITPEYAEFSKKTTKSNPFAIKIVSNTTDGTGYSYVSSDTSVATVSANGTVTPVGCGRTVITITTTGNKAYNPATATVTVTVKPTKGIISSLKSTAKGKLTVRYKKQSPNADYYQIRYGRAGDYTTKTIKNTTALTGKSTIKSLNSGKKYYVKVRGVKVLEDGTRLYGAWSVTKNAVTK